MQGTTDTTIRETSAQFPTIYIILIAAGVLLVLITVIIAFIIIKRKKKWLSKPGV